MKKVKVGVIGLGEVGQIIHLPILEALSDRYEIAALCDISPSLLEVMGEKYRVSSLYTDADQLAKQEDLDAVFVLNSDEYHADCAIAAIKQKKHVLIEKPMCLTLGEAQQIIKERDAAGVQVMVAYMRRFAPAFTEAVKEVRQLEKINYVRVRDIIGPNRFFIDQSSNVHRFTDFPEEAVNDKKQRAERLVKEAIGEHAAQWGGTYRFLCGLSSHDISAMRELVGTPQSVISAVKTGPYLNVLFECGDFHIMFETGSDRFGFFDASLEVFGSNKTIQVKYDTPYIRQLPTTLNVHETSGDSHTHRVVRPTYKDPYTVELEYFYDVVTKGITPKTTPEDAIEDLQLFAMIIEALANGKRRK